MNKEEFKNYVNGIAKNELRNSFDNNLMETLNSAFIFKYVETLEKENQKLKKQIEYLRRSIERKEETITELERERVPYVNEYAEKLKKQLEEANEKILLLQASEPMLEYKKALEENQQKEFIEFLENEKNINPYDISDYVYENIINTILLKYKEIIDK